MAIIKQGIFGQYRYIILNSNTNDICTLEVYYRNYLLEFASYSGSFNDCTNKIKGLLSN